MTTTKISKQQIKNPKLWNFYGRGRNHLRLIAKTKAKEEKKEIYPAEWNWEWRSGDAIVLDRNNSGAGAAGVRWKITKMRSFSYWRRIRGGDLEIRGEIDVEMEVEMRSSYLWSHWALWFWGLGRKMGALSSASFEGIGRERERGGQRFGWDLGFFSLLFAVARKRNLAGARVIDFWKLEKCGAELKSASGDEIGQLGPPQVPRACGPGPPNVWKWEMIFFFLASPSI